MLNNHIRAQILRMARITGTPLGETRWRVLDYVYNHFERHLVGPLYLNIKRHTGVDRDTLNRLFPYGLNSVYTWCGIPIQSIDRQCIPPAEISVKAIRKVYLDHNATTPIRPEVADCLSRYAQGANGFANPSSSTIEGKEAFDHLTRARRELARLLEAEPEEILFTGSGTEANNLALKGILPALSHRGEHIICSNIEHPSVLESVRHLQALGVSVDLLKADQKGVVDPSSLLPLLKKETRLVSVMAVNNEIGSIQPIAELAEICAQRGIPFHTDAVQAFGKIPLSVKRMKIALLSASAHKMYGPKGIGLLYASRDLELTPLIHGGGQEFGLRSGTENVGHAMAFAEAARLTHGQMKQEQDRLLALRTRFLEGLAAVEEDFIINGASESCVPGTLSIGFRAIDSGALLLSLNRIGIALSAGSACSAGKIETSHVLQAIGADDQGYGSVRISLGQSTSQEDIDYLLTHLPRILKILRSSG